MTEKVTTISAKVTPKIKKKVNNVLKSLGLNMSTATNLVLTQTAKTRRLPITMSVNDLQGKIAQQEAENDDTEYIGDTIEDFDKWVSKL